MKHLQIRKITSLVTSLLLVFQSFLPTVSLLASNPVYAQEETPTPEITLTPTPEETPAPTPTPVLEPTVTETPTPTPTPTETVTPTPTVEPTPTTTEPPKETGPPLPAEASAKEGTEQGQILDGVSTTAEAASSPLWQSLDSTTDQTTVPVQLGREYRYRNTSVSVVFTKLPDNPGMLTIKEIKLTTEQQEALGAFSDTAYDITSSMENGTFTYDLTLPLPESAKGKAVDVKTSETVDELSNSQIVDEQKEIKTDTITIQNLDHFTIFVLVPTGTAGGGIPNSVDTTVADTFIQEDKATKNFGGGTTGDVKSQNNKIRRFLAKFDLSPIPAGATISNATLKLYMTSAPGSNRTLQVYRITSDWAEGTGTGGGSDTSDVTWNSRVTSTSWSSAGGDFTGSAATVSSGTTDNTRLSWDVTSIVQSLYSGINTNYGFLVKDSAEGSGNDTATFATREDTTAANRPRLEVTFNRPPVSTDQSTSADEDTAKTITLSATDADSDTLTYSIVSNPSNGTLSGTGSVRTYTTNANYNGSDSFTFKANDGTVDSNTSTVNITVNAVNDPPIFNPIANQNVNEDASTQNVVITNVSPGPSDESGQTVTFTATSSNPSLIPNPTVSGAGANRTLAYTPVANANGSTTITVIANDEQAQNNTFARTFTITVNSVNDRPTITLNSPNGGEIYAGDSTQDITWTASDPDVGDTVIIDLEYTTDGGATYTPIASGLANTGTYSWTVPAIDSTTVTVRATASDGSLTADDSSDGTFMIDSTAPTDPADVQTTSHTSPSSNSTIDMAWTAAGSAPGATDEGSGVDGYSYTFSNAPAERPDVLKDIEESSTGISETVLSDGSWYFHLRTVDNAGNWTSTVHVGPMVVDTTPPTDPTPESSSHTTFSWSQGASVDVTWSGATDETSGVDGFYTEWNTSADTIDGPVVKEYEEGDSGETSPELADGDSHYFHIATVDNAGNWTGTAHLGPFYIDAEAPTDPGTPTADVSSPTNQTLITWTWDAAMDLVSGISQFIWNLWQDGEEADSGTTTETQLTTDVSSYGDGDFTFDVQAEDNADNTSNVISSSTTTVDTARPTVTAAQTQDTDGDGNIDAIKLTFSENIDDARLNIGTADGWDVADPAGSETIGTGDTANDNILVLTFGEGPTPDTANTPTVTYTPSGGPRSTHDLAGNELESYEGTPEDKALPVLLSAETQDTDANGKIDAIKLTFSEDIDDARLAAGTADGWDVDGYGDESIGTGDTANDTVLVLAFAEGPVVDTGATPTVTYTPSRGEDSTHDLAGNQLAEYSAAATDKAGPTTPVATPGAGDYTSDQLVTLASSDDGGTGLASIYYTTDGTEPSGKSGTLYSDPIAIGVDTTLKAIAYDNAGNPSEVLTAAYGIAPVISAEASSSVTSTSTTVTWTTDDPATSRVIYDTVSHAVLGAAPDYGYASSTATFDEDPKVLTHSVDISGLTAGTTYYYRTVSHGSPEAVSDEKTVTTSAASSDGGGGGGTSSSSGGGGGDGSPGTAPVCSDTKPASAPTLLSAAGGVNSVTLTWSAAGNPLTYYLVTYGASAGAQTYGNPNVGGAGTTSYTITNLSGGTTYYFRVRAGNGCAPGDYSNELSSTPGGGFVTGTAPGFAPGVLGATTEEELAATPSTSPTEPTEEEGEVLGTQPPGVPGPSLDSRPLWWFLARLFSGMGGLSLAGGLLLLLGM